MACCESLEFTRTFSHLIVGSLAEVAPSSSQATCTLAGVVPLVTGLTSTQNRLLILTNTPDKMENANTTDSRVTAQNIWDLVTRAGGATKDLSIAVDNHVLLKELVEKKGGATRFKK